MSKYSFDVKKLLNINLKAHDRKEKKIAAIKNPVKSVKCSGLCKSLTALTAHVKDVHPAFEYKCDLCGRKVKMKKGFKDHLSRFHKLDIKRVRGPYKFFFSIQFHFIETIAVV
ncbi:hypothetical protein ACKWTF_015874 [Chironomus riparius]